MKARQGYILLEVIVCTFIMSMLIMVLYSIIISAINTKDNIDWVERYIKLCKIYSLFKNYGIALFNKALYL